MFEYHILSEQGKQQVVTYNKIMGDAVKKVLEMMPEGREKALFKTKLEEASFFGTKAIASMEGNYLEKRYF